MRRAWPVLVLMLLVFVALWVRPPGTSTASRRPHLPAAVAPEPEMEAARDAREEKGTSTSSPADDAKPVEEKEEEYCPGYLRWLLANQNEEGGWGVGTSSLDGALIGKTGMTSLALLAILGAGYSHLSKDVYEGRDLGAAVRNALRSLIDDQREDGTFRSARSGLDQALAALALTEAYGMTGSNLFKAPAQNAIRSLGALQLQDGSWGDPGTTFWALDALKSAEIADLALPPSAYRELSAYYDRRASPDAAEATARVFIEKKKDHPAVAGALSRLAADPPTAAVPLPELYRRTRAMFQVDGPSGAAWKAWSEPFKAAVFQRPAPGGVNERVIHESLSALNLEIYVRYVNVFGAK